MPSTPGQTSLIPVRPGERLADRYLVERVVGTGGMGVVVAALHEQLGRTVAIKILTASTELQPQAVERFLREARAAASLRSEHIARVMDAGQDRAGRHFIVMEYLEGDDLASIIRRGEPLPVTRAVGYLLQACEALAEAHGQGIIHRDLKPENIFLTRRVDGSPLIKVLDFGISKITDPDRETGSLSASGPRSLLGSPLYMSPEQIRTPASIDPRSDVWALGVILFELLTGRRPFNAQSLPDILATILKDVPPRVTTLRPEVPARLADVVASCLEKEVGQRMASVGALAQALNEWSPRWARDSSVRASRLAGISSVSTLSLDLGNVPFAPRHEVEPPPAVTKKGGALVAALLMAGIAAGLLSAGAWLMYRSRNGSRSAASPPSAVSRPAEGIPPSSLPAAPMVAPARVPDPIPVVAPALPDRTTHSAEGGGHRSAAATASADNLRRFKRGRNNRPVKVPAVPVDPLEGRK